MAFESVLFTARFYMLIYMDIKPRVSFMRFIGQNFFINLMQLRSKDR